MATTSLATTGIAATLQKRYEKQLLQHAIQELRLNEFGKKPSVIPRNVGSKQIAWQRRVAGASGNVQALAEGVPISTFTEIDYTEVTATLLQYGEAAKITDIASWVSLNALLKDGIALMGEDCALKADDLTRAAIIAGVTAASQKRYPVGLADFTALSAATQAAGKLTAVDVLNAVTRLKINRSPKFSGYYTGIIPPQVSRDLMDDADWLEAAKYSNVEALYKGELGRLHGCRFVEATNPWIEDEAEGTFDNADGDSDGLIYATIITGQEAYGVANMAGQGMNGMKPTIIINDKPDKSDPLNQFMTVGWKAYHVAKVLNELYCTVIRSKSTFTS